MKIIVFKNLVCILLILTSYYSVKAQTDTTSNFQVMVAQGIDYYDKTYPTHISNYDVFIVKVVNFSNSSGEFSITKIRNDAEIFYDFAGTIKLNFAYFLWSGAKMTLILDNNSVIDHKKAPQLQLMNDSLNNLCLDKLAGPDLFIGGSDTPILVCIYDNQNLKMKPYNPPRLSDEKYWLNNK